MPNIPQHPIVLVDGSSYLFRAFHAMPPLTNSQGMPTGAIYGVVNMLKSLMLQFNPQQIGVIFDAKGKTFRDDMYPEYKANRPPMDPDLRCQIEPLHQIIAALGLPIYSVPGVEADDVIGTLSKQASSEGLFTVISTGDKDMAQLVDTNTVLINTMTDTIMDIDGVNEKFGVPPELIIDFLALKGDKVDNIPGVPGVGDKSAVGLLQGIGSINAIYQNLDDIAGLSFRGAKTMAKKMVEHEEQARMSYELATIKIDCELEFSLDDLTPKSQDNDTLVSLFTQYEMKRWLNDAKAGKPFFSSETVNHSSKNEETTAQPPTEQKAGKYKTITDQAEFNVWVEKLAQSSLICLDTETTSVNAMEAELVGLSFAV
ncbi:MAG: 5'-3' exonuclease H3TH domain-containing protein, partial [Glaciecola sp.]